MSVPSCTRSGPRLRRSSSARTGSGIRPTPGRGWYLALAGELPADGTGPVDAIYKAINRVTGADNKLTEFAVKAVTEGIDAQGEVTIRIEVGNTTFQGRAADPDILVAAARAYLHALNRSIATPAGAVPEPAGERN